MSVSTKKYQILGAPTPTFVRLAKVTNQNFTKIADWSKSDNAFKTDDDNMIYDARVRVRVVGKGIRAARVGDYVVKHEDGTFDVYKADAFPANVVLVK